MVTKFLRVLLIILSFTIISCDKELPPGTCRECGGKGYLYCTACGGTGSCVGVCSGSCQSSAKGRDTIQFKW